MITSPGNQRIKQIRRLKDRKFRRESGLFFVEGLRLVIEAVQQSAGVECLVVAPDLLTSDLGRKLIEDTTQDVDILEVSSELFASLSHKDGPQGIGALIRQRWTILDEIQPVTGLWVALDSIADPGNLGTILRTVEAVGGEGVILLDQSTDPYDPTAIRASMGAIFDLQIVRSTLAAFRCWKENVGIFLVGTDGEAELDYRQVKYPRSLVLLMGSEREGLLTEHYAMSNAMVRIPMVGSSDSLNLAVATGIMTYEIYNQWNPVGGGMR